MIEFVISIFLNILFWILVIGIYYFVLYRWFWDCLSRTIKRKEGYVTSLREYELGTAVGVCLHVLTVLGLITFFSKFGGWISI